MEIIAQATDKKFTVTFKIISRVAKIMCILSSFFIALNWHIHLSCSLKACHKPNPTNPSVNHCVWPRPLLLRLDITGETTKEFGFTVSRRIMYVSLVTISLTCKLNFLLEVNLTQLLKLMTFTTPTY